MNKFLIDYGPTDKAIYTLLVTAATEADARALFAERLPGERLIGITAATVGVAPIVAEEPDPEPAQADTEDEEPAKWKRRK